MNPPEPPQPALFRWTSDEHYDAATDAISEAMMASTDPDQAQIAGLLAIAHALLAMVRRMDGL